MNLYEFATNSPWLAFFLFWLFVLGVEAVFKSLAVVARGYPPPKKEEEETE